MENKKEELKKLESKYNNYVKIIKFILLIVLFVGLILATRFIYLFSIAHKIIQAQYIDIKNENLKITHFSSHNEYPEDDATIAFYYKDGVSIMEANSFKNYTIDGKVYSFYSNGDKKTYSIRDSIQSEDFENISTFERLVGTASLAKSYFTKNIRHENLNGESCIVFTDEYNKVYYSKETFLQLKSINSHTTTEIQYEFDVVTDEDITLPDLSEYVLEED